MLICFVILVAVSLFAGWKLGQGDIFTTASVTLCAFLAMANVAIMIALGLNLSKVGLMAVFILLALLMTWRVSVSGSIPVVSAQNGPNRAAKVIAYVKFAVVLLVAIFLTVLFPTVDHSSADTVHHLGIANKYINAETLSFDIFSLSIIYPKDIIFFAYAGNTYNLIIGFVSEALNADPQIVFNLFTIGSLLFLMLGAHHLTQNIAKKYESNTLLNLLFLVPVLVVLSLFFPHTPADYVGFPYLPWASYPSIFAMAATFHLLALIVRFSGAPTQAHVLIVFVCTFAAASLHAGFTVAVGAFCLSYIALKFAWDSFKKIPGPIGKTALLYSAAVIIPLALAMALKLYAISGMNALDAPDLSEVTSASWVNETAGGYIFNMKAIAHKRLPLYVVSLFLLVVTYAVYSWRKRSAFTPSLSEFCLLWCVCFASVAVMYTPVFTPFLIDILSAELMFRIQWIPEAILPVISVALIFRLLADQSLKSAIWIKGPAVVGLCVATGLTVWGGATILKSTEAYLDNREVMLQRNNFVQIANVKSNHQYVAFLQSLNRDDRYIVTSFSHGAGSHKRVEMALTTAQLMTPPYTLFDYEKEVTKGCTLHLAQDKPALVAMLEACQIDYVISYAWPIAESMTGQKRLDLEVLQDPLSTIGQYEPSRKFEIPSALPDPVYVNVYDVSQDTRSE